jgi:transcriptional regulator with XRE-family HTH domain
MKERIFEFLKAENKSSSLFAEEIGVQPSGVSHILSGRNNPSLDFIIKMLEKYRYLSTEWLLFGKGSMYKDGSGMPSLFDQDLTHAELKSERSVQPRNDLPEVPDNHMADIKQVHDSEISGAAVTRIVWFYSDGSFREYSPRR